MHKYKTFLIVSLAAALSACSVVSPQEVGLKVSKAGQKRGVDNITVANGYVTYNPIMTSVVTYPRTVQGVKWDNTEGHGGDLTFRSNGGVRVSAPVAMNFQVIPEQTPQIYSKFGRNLDLTINRNLKQIVQDSMNRVGSQYTPSDLVGQGSVLFEDKVTALIKDEFEKIGFQLVTFSLPEGIHPPKSISDAIDATQRAKQEALAVENQLATTKAQAQKVIAEAQGRAQAAILLAEGQAKANRILAQSVTPQLVEYQKVQKWDGKNPSTVVGSGSSTLVSVK